MATLRPAGRGGVQRNHTMKPFIEDVFAEIVRAAPPVVSSPLGCRADLIARVHAAGAIFVQQVHTPAQAAEAVEGALM
ncbi:MAG TPA: hypothetical protein VM142_01385 [Acidimicrobiales bacterium]|nr:hypothetical protein [Acidimicrobiales bacterium]